MPNLARSASPRSVPAVGRPTPRPAPADLLAALAAARADQVLPGLDPATYARDHAAFEARSDQRALISAHLHDRLARRAAGPVAVLSVGCGDGALDAPLAAALADARPPRPVRYVGVEPYAGSAGAFEAALSGLHRPALEVEVHATTFEAFTTRPRDAFDVVTFVHSLYYVPDVAATLRAAYDLLRPGGELVVLNAPRGELNALVDVLAPPLAGHRQWFSDDVAAGLGQAGLVAEDVICLQAGVELATAPDPVLDFAVQARLTVPLRALVRDYLRAVARPGPDAAPLVTPPVPPLVPHPVDAFRVIRPVRTG